MQVNLSKMQVSLLVYVYFSLYKLYKILSIYSYDITMINIYLLLNKYAKDCIIWCDKFYIFIEYLHTYYSTPIWIFFCVETDVKNLTFLPLDIPLIL